MFCCSWQKTLTTFWPVIISSMNPLSLPRFFCWATKFLPDREVTLTVRNSIRPIMARVTKVRGRFRTTIMEKILMMVMVLLKSWGILWLTICRRVSISLV